jgi:transcriptional regulator with XRE-family HTH domain
VPGQEEVADMANNEQSAELHKRFNLCGVHLRRYRLEKHLTLADLQATLELDYGIHLDRTNLGRIENSERTVSDVELVIFAHLLNISVERLLWGDSLPDANFPGESLKHVEMRYAARYPKKKQKR